MRHHHQANLPIFKRCHQQVRLVVELLPTEAHPGTLKNNCMIYNIENSPERRTMRISRVIFSTMQLTMHLTTTISRHGNGIALTAGRSSIIMHQDTLNNLAFQYCGSAQRKSTSGCIDKTAKALLAVTISSLANNVTWASPMPHDIDSILPRADLHIPTFAVSSVVGHSTVLYQLVKS